MSAPDDAEPTSAWDTTFAVSSEIEDVLRSAAGDPSIKALLVDVESYGGGPVAGDEIAIAISHFGKPSVAVVHEVAASSGYLAAAGADVIFASEDSTVGSIGATISYVDNVLKNKEDGLTFNQLSSGAFKDTLNPNKTLTAEERALIMRDIKISHENFVRLISEYRGQPIEKIAALADGSTMMGRAALKAGLIDRIGGTEEALSYLEQAIGEPPVLCY